MNIASVQTLDPVAPRYADFLKALAQRGFTGEIQADYAHRTVLATDNSIYQRLPQAAVFPRSIEDVRRVASLMGEKAYSHITLTPRGGGTGTNGQSLTDGIVVDLSRHLNQILEINVEERWVRVRAGVVKDQLNAALKPHGLFFAPELSTSNRATLGGMINTDASGQGSCKYGKTRDHVLELDMVLLGGEDLHGEPLDKEQLEQACALSGRVGEVFRTARQISEERAEQIEKGFPKLNRCLTGYDLAHLWEQDGRFNVNSVLCGAEGTLGFVVEAKLNVLPIPKFSTLINVRYGSFMDALRDAHALQAQNPLSIETVDSKVLMLAMKDFVWNSVSEYFPQDERPTLGINLVEFSGDSEAEVDAQVQTFIAHLQQDQTVTRLGHTIAQGSEAVTRVYGMRKRAVGLLGNVEGEARPQPFVEDAAVPPENLADFIAEFRAVLDSHNLEYGMFGHVDAGVLHVRPALDMKDPAQAAMIRPISDAVAELAQRYGGLLWGEHGKGVRSEYAPAFFGDLYPALQQLKAAFDPHNQLNPGKIATPATQPEAALLKIDKVTLRGEYDRQMPLRTWQSFGTPMHCNGNGACFNYDLNDAMCPSWKATRERTHSPKGRASLMREWLRLQEQSGVDVLAVEQEPQSFWKGLWKKRAAKQDPRETPDFSHEVYDAMSGCLACKSCVGQCPIKVNIPELRSRFLGLYHRRYARPLRDYLIASLEYSMPYLSKMPWLYNGMLRQKWVQGIMEKRIGMTDSPLFSSMDFAKVLQQWNVRPATPLALTALTAEERARSVILVQDVFTRYFETPVLAALIELASRLGYQVWLAPLNPNGKPLHVQGFRKAFAKAAIHNTRQLQTVAGFDIPLVGLDPAMTLVYRQEYTSVPDIGIVPQVQLPQEWLLNALPEDVAVASTEELYRLLPHCTEKTNAPNSIQPWAQLFKRCGLSLTIPAAGCCGMSGTYGHESRNQETSKTIFSQSWAKHLEAPAEKGEVLATGYSCRSQVKRLNEQSLRHPLQVLLAHISQHAK